MPGISRRDFLKILSLSPVAALVRRMVGASRLTAGGNPPNIVILVFDAWSADHMSLHGYPRRTMPNVEQFAEKAVVYHRHYSAGTFTMPGTASLLTGLHPWSHRALTLGGEIDVRHREHQIFHVVSPTHSTLGYAQNEYADLLLFELARDLDQHVSIDSFSLARLLTYSSEVFRNDPQVAYASFENDIFQNGTGADGSLFVGALRRLTKWRTRKALDAEYRMTYPTRPAVGHEPVHAGRRRRWRDWHPRRLAAAVAGLPALLPAARFLSAEGQVQPFVYGWVGGS